MRDPIEEALAALVATKPKEEPVLKVSPKGRPVYSPAAMVQVIIDNPQWTHRQYASHFGYNLSWFAAVIASDNFQSALDSRRHEVVDPTLTATLEERFRSLLLRSMQVMQDKMEKGDVSDLLVAKAAEIGVKALGIGTPASQLPPPPGAQGLEQLASRLTAMLPGKSPQQAQVHVTIDIPSEIVDVPSGN